jgi:hypothetical protein
MFHNGICGKPKSSFEKLFLGIKKMLTAHKKLKQLPAAASV